MKVIKETTLHPYGNEGVDLYPKTNINQVQELPKKLTSVENQINQLNVDKLTKPTNPSAESVVTMLADGTVGTKPLSEIGGSGVGVKLYRHKIVLNNNYMTAIILYVYRLTPDHIPINSLGTYCNGALAIYGDDVSQDYIGRAYFTNIELSSFDGTIINPITEPHSWKTVNLSHVQLSVYEAHYEELYTVTEV